MLQSRNAGVVVAAAALHYYLGSGAETTSRMIGAALVHRLRGPRETRFAVLQTVSQMAAARPNMFRDHLRAFFVHARDPLHTRVQKLDVLVSLADEACVSQLLGEMQHYCRDPDKAFVTAAVRAVGRIAANVPSVAERVLRGLMALVQVRRRAALVALAGGEEDRTQSSDLARRSPHSPLGRATTPLLWPRPWSSSASCCNSTPSTRTLCGASPASCRAQWSPPPAPPWCGCWASSTSSCAWSRRTRCASSPSPSPASPPWSRCRRSTWR